MLTWSFGVQSFLQILKQTKKKQLFQSVRYTLYIRVMGNETYGGQGH